MLKTEWLATTIERLQQNDPTLTSIKYMNHHFTPIEEFLNSDDAIALADALRGNAYVTSIHIESSHNLNEGGVAIVNVLKNNDVVTSLTLRENRFDNKAIIAISELLKVNKTLTTLNLCGNHLNASGIIILCEGLKKNTSVRNLHLGYTNMRDDGVIALGQALEVNKTLKYISMDGNYYSQSSANVFLKSLEKNYSLTTLITNGWIDRGHHLANLLVRNKKVVPWSRSNHATEVCPELHTLVMATLMSANRGTTTNTLSRILPELWEEHIFPHFNTFGHL